VKINPINAHHWRYNETKRKRTPLGKNVTMLPLMTKGESKIGRYKRLFATRWMTNKGWCVRWPINTMKGFWMWLGERRWNPRKKFEFELCVIMEVSRQLK